METAEIEARVQAGVAWMDANGPDGWVGMVSLATLDVNSPERCVLGQVFAEPGGETNGFNYVMESMLDSDEEVAASLGFSTTAVSFEDRGDELSALTGEWLRVLQAKRKDLELTA